MSEREESSLSALSIVLIVGLALFLGVGCLGALFFGFRASPGTMATPAPVSSPPPPVPVEESVEDAPQEPEEPPVATPADER